MHPDPRSKSRNDLRQRHCVRPASPAAGMSVCALLLVLMTSGCMQDGPVATGAPGGEGRNADTERAAGAVGDYGSNLTPAPPGLAPDRMPTPLADFPLPEDAIFVAPPLREFGRLIVTLNSQADADKVAALFNARLPAKGYELTRKVVAGTTQWQFIKDGRRGLVAVERNRLATVITINLFIEDRT